MTDAHVPKYHELWWPTLKALEARGGSARIQELSEQMASDLGLSDEALNVLHSDGRLTAFNYRAAWSRTYLKNAGLIENTSRGVWAITEQGRAVQSDDEVRELVKKKARELYGGSTPGSTDPDPEPDGDQDEWKARLLKTIRSIDPGAFERLCGLMLRRAGFTSVEITGRSGDGGIDGVGILRVNLISFHMLFQCKRFSGSVGAGSVRDFRGAMTGRADKGLIITTGTFTHEARREAVRDGAPPIDLIDGSDLCDLLREQGLGVQTVPTPDQEFFDKL